MSLCKLQTSNQSKLCLSYASTNANISKSMLAKKCRLSKNQDFSSMLKISLMLSTVIVPMLGSGLILGADEGVSGSTSLERKYCQVGYKYNFSPWVSCFFYSLSGNKWRRRKEKMKPVKGVFRGLVERGAMDGSRHPRGLSVESNLEIRLWVYNCVLRRVDGVTWNHQKA